MRSKNVIEKTNGSSVGFILIDIAQEYNGIIWIDSTRTKVKNITKVLKPGIYRYQYTKRGKQFIHIFYLYPKDSKIQFNTERWRELFKPTNGIIIDVDKVNFTSCDNEGKTKLELLEILKI